MEPVLFVVAIIASTQHTQATEKAIEAYRKQIKIDEALDTYQRKLLSEQTRHRLGQVALVAKVAIDRKVTLRWEFP